MVNSSFSLANPVKASSSHIIERKVKIEEIILQYISQVDMQNQAKITRTRIWMDCNDFGKYSKREFYQGCDRLISRNQLVEGIETGHSRTSFVLKLPEIK